VSFSTRSQQLQLFTPTGEAFGTYEDVVQERDRQRQEKELERQEKERQQQRADRAESDLQQLREKLRQLNIDPDSLL
jgi:DNA-binding protein H-NS